jgi:hypothetical protein
VLLCVSLDVHHNDEYDSAPTSLPSGFRTIRSR